ncbi:MAG: rhomboid family intramembrane serine protease [Thermoplasmata archaeon]|nr:rhomboid family intramembrane serine protease [Thermoplasmata archaeon]
MNPETSRQYNSQYGERAYRPEVPDDTIWGRVIKPNLVTYAIIVICIAVFLVEMVDLQMAAPYAMWPDDPMPWMFVTSIFIHIDFTHLFFNMFMLFMFGVTLERMIGPYRFLGLFLVAGVVGNLGYVVYCLATGITNPAIGASGAIYGVFTCLAILAPNIRVYLFFFIPLKIIHALMLYAVIDILFIQSDDNIAHAAHIAGLLVGLVFALYLKKKLLEKQSYSVSYQFNAEQ